MFNLNQSELETAVTTAFPDFEIPEWIEQDISFYDVQNIIEGGCASGAYMPAVTYFKANKTMSQHGNDVLQYLEDNLGEIPTPKKIDSWTGLAVYYLSSAVELWASTVSDELIELIDDQNDDQASEEE